MKFHTHPFQSEHDYDSLRKFLRETFVLNDFTEKNWPVQRLDYLYWHIWRTCLELPPDEGACMVSDERDDLLGAVIMEAFGVVFLQVHPDHYRPDLIAFMVEHAEEHYFKSFPEGAKKLIIWCEREDRILRDVLTARGYEKGKWQDRCGRIDLTTFEPEVKIPQGFSVRSLGDESELPARSWLSWRAFHPDEPDENYGGWQWYRNIQRAPLYRRDLDIVAVADDGTLAGFTTVWYDDVNRAAYFEPVGVEPKYHRKGLARAMIHEGMRRLKEIEARWAFLGSNVEPTHTIYRRCGFVDAIMFEGWLKVY